MIDSKKSRKYPKIIDVWWYDQELNHARQTRDQEGYLWTKKTLDQVRREFTGFCEHYVDLILVNASKYDDLQELIDDCAENSQRNWHHWAGVDINTDRRDIELRCWINLDGSPFRMHYHCNISRKALTKRIGA